MAATIGMHQVIEAKRLVQEAGLDVDIHWHDVCGSPTCSLGLPANIDDADADARDEMLARTREVVIDAFSGWGVPVEFLPDGVTFRAVR